MQTQSPAQPSGSSQQNHCRAFNEKNTRVPKGTRGEKGNRMGGPDRPPSLSSRTIALPLLFLLTSTRGVSGGFSSFSSFSFFPFLFSFFRGRVSSPSISSLQQPVHIRKRQTGIPLPVPKPRDITASQTPLPFPHGSFSAPVSMGTPGVLTFPSQQSMPHHSGMQNSNLIRVLWFSPKTDRQQCHGAALKCSETTNITAI